MHGRFILIVYKAVKFSGIILLLWTIGGIVSMAGSLTYVKLGILHKVGILFYKKFLIIF